MIIDKCVLCATIMIVKKTVILDYLATKELSAFSIEVRAKFNDLFEILSKEGKLEMPFAKKIEN